MADLPDPRERAFVALRPLAPIIARALGDVDARVAADAERNAAAWGSWHPAQRKTHAGYGRFCDATHCLRTALEPVRQVSFISTASQEASNLYFWQVADWLILRVKSEPSELAYEATEPLFARSSSTADETVCLTWEVAPHQTIRDARFVSLHRVAPWSITLLELLAAPSDGDGTAGVVVPIGPRLPSGPPVRSSRPDRPAEADTDADPAD